LGSLRKRFYSTSEVGRGELLPLVAPLVLLLSLGSGCGWFSTKHTKRILLANAKIETFM